MNSYLNKPTPEEQLTEYLKSEDIDEDIRILQNEYFCRGQTIPPLEQLRSEAIAQQQELLKQMAVCDAQGHQFTETADGENGTSELDCNRCGMTFHCQW